MNINNLSYITFPPVRYSSFTDLFCRRFVVSSVLNDHLSLLNKYSFNTWMNSFSAKKYFYYCDIEKLYLRLDVEGDYRVTVIGANISNAFGIEENVISDEYYHNESLISIPSADKYDSIYFNLYEDVKAPIVFSDGAWCTDASPKRINHLSIVTCTFKRESYVYKNLDIFKDFLAKRPELNGRIRYIFSDNGKSLDLGKATKDIIIYPNMNAGGAGGFARGLIEIMNHFQDTTHILYMNDDVEIFPESFHKTLMLCDYLKDEFKDSLINGAMLDIYNKLIFFENIGVRDGLWVHPVFNSANLADYREVIRVNKIDPEIFNNAKLKIHGAWYFHCFSMETAREKGFPLPLFIRGDDVEWSWRNFGKHHITMNGICIWHSPFVWKVSQMRDNYYLPRNMFFNNVIHQPNFKSEFRHLFVIHFNNLIQTFNYHGIDLFFRALKDILRGSEVFFENPESQFNDIKKNFKKNNIHLASQFEIDKAFRFKRHVHKWQKILYKHTNMGINAPKCFYKGTGWTLDGESDLKKYIFLKQVFVVNPLTKQCEIRKFRSSTSKRYQKEFIKLLAEIEANYDSIQRDYINAYSILTSKGFWEKLLRLRA